MAEAAAAGAGRGERVALEDSLESVVSAAAALEVGEEEGEEAEAAGDSDAAASNQCYIAVVTAADY